jgi:hypothetical protein
MAINTLYANAAGTVSIDMRDAGRIKGILVLSNMAAAGSVEVSFNSSSQSTTTDTTGVICGLLNQAGTGQSVYIDLDEPVDVGERIYMHTTGISAVRAFIYTDSATVKASPRRR